MKTKNYLINYARYTMLKNHFLWLKLGHMTVLRISKKKSVLQLAYQNHDTVEISNHKKKMIVKFNYIL